jgi:exopolysaccharide biosynthesis polyprenyl glycosylphosphotransferase
MSRFLFFYFFVVDAILLIGWRIVYRIAWRVRRDRLARPRRVLVVGAGEVGRRTAETIDENAWMGFHLVGFVDDDPDKQNTRVAGLPVLGPLKATAAIVREHATEEVIVALPLSAYQKVVSLSAELQRLPVHLRVVPDYFNIALFRATVEDFGGMPLINLRAPALNDYQRLVKRMFDLTVGALFLVVSIPFMAITAFLIKRDSRGPAVYKQERVGENGRVFWMYKFRTMVEDADARLKEVIRLTEDGGLDFKRPDDPRVTRLGRFLRRTSLDELPQLFNVLKGEMSLVGPRPELPWLVDRYELWQHKRFAVPQGMTGWWQVNGRSSRHMHLSTEDDLYYIQNYSLLLDLLILWKTVGAVLKRHGAF